MKKRVLYYCRVNRDDLTGIGLVRKCLGQVEGLRAAGFDVDMLWLCDNGVLLNEKLVIKTPWKIKPHTWWCYAFYYLFMHRKIMRRVNLAGYELFFARYELSHPMLLRFLKRLRALNPKARMVMEIPSYPYEREMSGFLRQIQYGIDHIWRNRLKNVLDYLVTPGLYIRLFGLPVITMPNGISVDNIPVAKWCQEEGVLRLVGTGNWRWWHGVDRIIDALEKYYRKGKPPVTITVHLVGSTDQLPWIQQAIREKGLAEYVKLSPPRQGKLLDEVFDEADVGIGAFRNDLPHGFPLKHREYAVRGLPFIYSMPDPGFQGVEDCLIVIPNDDSPVDFDEVVEKYKSLGKDYRERLREHALQHFSWETIMARMVAELMKEGNETKGKVLSQDALSAAKESTRS